MIKPKITQGQGGATYLPGYFECRFQDSLPTLTDTARPEFSRYMGQAWLNRLKHRKFQESYFLALL